MIPKNIVIIEDEPITARYIEGILNKYGSHVVAIYNSFKGVKQELKDKEIDLILMDINILGPVDGIEASKRIQADYDIPIIFISAYSDSDTIEEVLKVAPYGFVTKPFTENDLLIAIKVGYGRYISTVVDTQSPKENHLVKITDICYYHRLQKRLYIEGKPVKLSANQNRLLEELIQSHNNPVSQEQLIYAIWNDQDISASALRTLVYSLRKLLPQIPIESVSKSGYVLRSYT